MDSNKHFHRLKPAIEQIDVFTRKPAPTGGKLLFGAAALKHAANNNLPFQFYFSDNGFLYYGTTENDLYLVKGSFKEPPKIHWSDLENTFRLGMAVAHLQHTEFTKCAPVPLQLLDSNRVEPFIK